MDQLHMIHLLEQSVAVICDGAKALHARAAARAAGIALIESELGYIFDELKLRPDGRDMTEWGLPDLRKVIPSLHRVLDAALGASTADYVVKKYSVAPLSGKP